MELLCRNSLLFPLLRLLLLLRLRLRLTLWSRSPMVPRAVAC